MSAVLDKLTMINREFDLKKRTQDKLNYPDSFNDVVLSDLIIKKTSALLHCNLAIRLNVFEEDLGYINHL